jgi:hypothetical protein
MTSTTNFRPVTASDVREHFRNDQAAFDALSEAAQNTVAKGARGRLHPEAREAFNKGRKPSEQYGEGAPRTIALTYKHVTKSAPKGRNKTVHIPEAEARALAGEVAGKRGPLSKAALVAAAEALSAQRALQDA